MEKHKSAHYLLGKIGEEIALNYLKQKKYKILDKNYKGLNGEIDIIAIDKKSLVFVEVKTRSSYNYGLPSEAINLKKQKFLIETAQLYLSEIKKKYKEYRFDVIEIIYCNKTKTLKEIILTKDAFCCE